jgi:hypothetical protein
VSFLCRAFNIPLKLRCPKEATFTITPEDEWMPLINVLVEDWYNYLIYPAGYWP